MFGGFFSPGEVKNRQCHYSNCRAHSGQQLRRCQELGLPQPLCTASGVQGDGMAPALTHLSPAAKVSWSQQVDWHEIHHGQKLPESHGMGSVFLLRDLPDHLNPSWFLRPTCSAPCVHLAGFFQGWRGGWDLTLPTQRGAPRCPKPPGKSICVVWDPLALWLLNHTGKLSRPQLHKRLICLLPATVSLLAF